MANEQNLTPWKPGQSGNPAGSSKKQRLTARLMEYIDRKGISDELIEAWLGAAIGDPKMLKGRKPDFAFLKDLIDRVDGKASESTPDDDAAAHDAPKQIVIPDVDDRHAPDRPET